MMADKFEPGNLMIHPGFHKTGTTYLQKEIFSQDQFFQLLARSDEIAEIIERPSDLEYSSEEALQNIQTQFGFDSNKPNILSSETFCGNPFFGSREAKALADRLFDTFGTAKILFTVREQRSSARSLYKQYVKMGGLARPESFFRNKYIPQFGSFRPETLNYGNLVDYYANLFGTENILVLAQEQLRNDAGTFFDSLGAFLGTDLRDIAVPPSIMASPSVAQLRLYRLSNLFLTKPINPDLKFGPAIIGTGLQKFANLALPNKDRRPDKLDQIISDSIGTEYTYGNEILQKFCDVDLSSLGYAMPVTENL